MTKMLSDELPNQVFLLDNCPPLVPVQVLLASCFVPVYAGLKPVELRGKVRVYAGVRTKSIGS